MNFTYLFWLRPGRQRCGNVHRAQFGDTGRRGEALLTRLVRSRSREEGNEARVRLPGADHRGLRGVPRLENQAGQARGAPDRASSRGGRAAGRAELLANFFGGAVRGVFRENANCGDPPGTLPVTSGVTCGYPVHFAGA